MTMLSTPLRSSYAEYLPPPLQADPFIGRFLLIVESVVAPIEQTVDTLAEYFDPLLTPEEMLPWLSGWVAQEQDEHWGLHQRRALVARAAVLHRWRGTRRALRERLSLYAGRVPLIVENFSGLRLGQDAALGVNTLLGQVQPNTVGVTLMVDIADTTDELTVRRIIEYELPVGVNYTLAVYAPDQRVRLNGGNP